MGISLKEVDYIAKLARLELSEAEREKYTHELNQILSYVDKLNELDTKDIKATTHVLSLSNVFRKDEVKSSLIQEEIFSNAPEIEKGCFKVKKVIE